MVWLVVEPVWDDYEYGYTSVDVVASFVREGDADDFCWAGTKLGELTDRAHVVECPIPDEQQTRLVDLVSRARAKDSVQRRERQAWERQRYEADRERRRLEELAAHNLPLRRTGSGDPLLVPIRQQLVNLLASRLRP
jgi:hypothetical protein